MTLDPNTHLLLADIETTGLDAHDDIILEVGLMVVTLDFKPVSMVSELVAPGYEIDWDALNVNVQKMHEQSGLRDLIDSGKGEPIDDVEGILVNWYEEMFGDAKVPLSGSSIHFDRGFFKVHMPEFESLASYRNIDWSSIKELCTRYNPEVYAHLPAKEGKHRAIPDLFDTITEAKFYVDNFVMATRPEIAEVAA